LFEGKRLKTNNGAFFLNYSHNKIKTKKCTITLTKKEEELRSLHPLFASSHKDLQLIESKTFNIHTLKISPTNHDLPSPYPRAITNVAWKPLHHQNQLSNTTPLNLETSNT
jgi:hypothetical protein